MEIGAEISKKIRAAIKGKLQELGAYIDEELPDYIMVMVANKKTPQQMADDLSLFLGSNTVKFTDWLHGVLEKLRTVAGEPASVQNQLLIDDSTGPVRNRLYIGEDSRAEESKVLAVSSSRSDRAEASVSSSAYESRKETLEKGSSRLTSAVKPLIDLLPSEAVIDIKPEMDDDLIAVELEMGTSRTINAARRPTAEVYRPGQNMFTSIGSSDAYRPTGQDSRSNRVSRNGSNKEEFSRKRKAPVASSVVRVSRAADEDSDDFEEDEGNHGGRGLSSRVSLPSKPDRKPTLPPAKQANRNLILKAISEAQDSIAKTTTYSALPKRQTVPVAPLAPRARLASSEEMTAAIQLVQEHLNRAQAYTSPSLPPSGTHISPRSLSSRLQVETQNEKGQSEYEDVDEAADGDSKKIDTRSFIMSRPQLEGSPGGNQQQVQPALPRTVQACKEKSDSSSPKFIVTLDGVPSALENLTDCDMELDDVRPPSKLMEASSAVDHRRAKVSILDRLQDVSSPAEDELMEVENSIPVKKQKVTERCKFWPVCKSGDGCAYHHPTTQCKTFPNCKFGDKCLFVHPNCKYDARCTKPDCPFTHVSCRSIAAPPPLPLRPAVKQVQTTSVCRFFPDCKKMECPFYHPKPCRYAAQCKRVGCTFYHPTTSVPPRHALKWTKAQSS
ncbi:zinc finger CCCH domain-containing protein 14 isoform X1 [Gouania willdenowi]|uniref:Zinc finger CCCH domain-containing protein 14 n=1 Tax=Gouania willdenowi TaxID=441366 RepID=A0A8C5DMI5_GOUWI|nr:zinc finger CCCH domain-containing protein 14 isoform X1 [Gouania willdenowi]